jgi:hypothetical protein
LLEDVTLLLRDALDLMRELEGASDTSDLSYIARPSIVPHAQNSDFRGWTALIDLLRQSWLSVVELHPEQAKAEVQRWQLVRYPLFRRFTFFACTETELFRSSQAVEWLLQENAWWLWSVETEREGLRLLAKLASSSLSPSDQARVESAVLAGPPRNMFKSDTDPEQLQRIVEREVWLRLAKMQNAGLQLNDDAMSTFSRLSDAYPQWELAADQSDEFPFWMGDGEDIFPAASSTPKSSRELADWLIREHGTSEQGPSDNWQDRCRSDLPRCMTALLRAADAGQWPGLRWSQALQAWSDDKFAARSWRHAGAAIARMPSTSFPTVASAAGRWLQELAKTFSGNERLFFELCGRVLDVVRHAELEADEDPLFRAINHPVGHVVEAIFRHWYRGSVKDRQGLDEQTAALLARIADTRVSIFLHGRVLLGAHVIALFRVDERWTSRNVLPLFDWKRPLIEARAIWFGFLWSPRLYRPLFEAIKKHFVATAEHYEQLGRVAEQYASLLTFAGLEPGETFLTREIADLLAFIPQQGRDRASDTLVRALEGAAEQRSEYWRNRVVPFVKRIWPKSKSLQSEEVARNFAMLCIRAREEFRDAVDQLKYWLSPLKQPDHVVYQLRASGLSKQFPKDALTFLDIIIDETAERLPHALRECLDEIRGADPSLSDDERFRRLSIFLR